MASPPQLNADYRLMVYLEQGSGQVLVCQDLGYIITLMFAAHMQQQHLDGRTHMRSASVDECV